VTLIALLGFAALLLSFLVAPMAILVILPTSTPAPARAGG